MITPVQALKYGKKMKATREAVAKADMTAMVTSSLGCGLRDSKAAKKGSIISRMTTVLVR